MGRVGWAGWGGQGWAGVGWGEVGNSQEQEINNPSKTMLMRNADYGLTTSQTMRPKLPLVRPHSSHQRPTSLVHTHHRPPASPPRSPLRPHPSHEYYAQPLQRSLRSPAKPSLGGQSLQKLRKSLSSQLQKVVSALQQQIQQQSMQILQLERRLAEQGRDLDLKDAVIRELVMHVHAERRRDRDREGRGEREGNWAGRRVEDLESRLAVLVHHVEEEREEMERRIVGLAEGVVGYFGRQLQQCRGRLFAFTTQKQATIDFLTNCFEKALKQTQAKVAQLQPKLHELSHTLTQLHPEDLLPTAKSLSVQSKNSLISTSASNGPREEMFLSDYFFHPAGESSLAAVEQLARERGQALRVYVDSSGRMKYFESRTFVFDRMGNFTVVSAGQLAEMERRGWVRVLPE